MSNDDKKMEAFTLPEGRIINHSLFVKDAYDDKAVPSYKVEIAIPEDDPGLVELENLLCDAADDKWGAGAGDDPDLIFPLLEGDKLARKREKKGKDGAAYKGMTVIRANTIYNKDGVDGAGGIQVFDPDAELVPVARQGEVYQGCYAIVAVTLSFYESNDGNNAMKFYLAAIQKTRDGERLVTATDRSSMFKPTGRNSGGSSGRRRRTRG